MLPVVVSRRWAKQRGEAECPLASDVSPTVLAQLTYNETVFGRPTGPGQFTVHGRNGFERLSRLLVKARTPRWGTALGYFLF